MRMRSVGVPFAPPLKVEDQLSAAFSLAVVHGAAVLRSLPMLPTIFVPLIKNPAVAGVGPANVVQPVAGVLPTANLSPATGLSPTADSLSPTEKIGIPALGKSPALGGSPPPGGSLPPNAGLPPTATVAQPLPDVLPSVTDTGPEGDTEKKCAGVLGAAGDQSIVI